MRAQFTLQKMRFQPTQSAGQLGLFDRDFRSQPAEAESDSGREPGALTDEPKPGAIWNGRIWVTDADVGF
jgi:hypothetical protein